MYPSGPKGIFVIKMENIIGNIKKYRTALIVLLGTGIFLAVIINSGEKHEVKNPITDPSIPPKEIEKTLDLTNTTPKNGSMEEDFQYIILLEFSERPLVKSIKYEVKPKINLEIKNFEHSPNSLYIFPSGELWEEGIKYTLEINTLRGEKGSILKKPIEFIYYFNPPKNHYEGDDIPAK